MKTNLLKSVFVFLIAVSGFKASAQDLSPVRHYFGVNYNRAQESVEDLPVRTMHTSGSVVTDYPAPFWANSYGISYEYALPGNDGNRNHVFSGRLNFYTFDAKSANMQGVAIGYNTTTNTTEPVWNYSNNAISYSILNLSFAWKKRFFKTPVFLSIGPNITFIPSSKVSRELFIMPYELAEGKQFLPEPNVELSENNSVAKVHHSQIGDSKWNFGLQGGIFVEFEVPNFAYAVSSKQNNFIILAPYALLTPSITDLKYSFTDTPAKFGERPWRESSFQVGLDIRMPMPF